MKFKLEIELGNDAMQTGEDIAAALHHVAGAIDTIGDMRGADPYDKSGVIRDLNGNRVGQWKVVGR